MLTVPLIIEKIFKGKVKKMFTSNSFMNALYGVGFIRRYLHRIAGKKLTKTFGGRIRFFGIGGSKLDSEVEQFLLDSKFIYDVGYGLTETAPLIAGMVDGMLRNQIKDCIFIICMLQLMLFLFWGDYGII